MPFRNKRILMIIGEIYGKLYQKKANKKETNQNQLCLRAEPKSESVIQITQAFFSG